MLRMKIMCKQEYPIATSLVFTNKKPQFFYPFAIRREKRINIIKYLAIAIHLAF